MGKLHDLLGAGIGMAVEASASARDSNKKKGRPSYERDDDEFRSSQRSTFREYDAYDTKRLPFRDSTSFDPPRSTLNEYDTYDTKRHSYRDSGSYDSPPDYETSEKHIQGSNLRGAERQSPRVAGYSDCPQSARDCKSRGAPDGPLALPVIIPQRRPNNQERGFALCYAPQLQRAGIQQHDFLEFLQSFNKSSKSSAVFDVINIAALGVGFAPGIAPMIVSMTVPMAVKVAKTAQVKRGTKNFLDKANEQTFQPRGLYALVMTHKADEANQKTITANGNGPLNFDKRDAIKQIGKGIGFQSNQNDANTTHGDVELPEAAALVWPSDEDVDYTFKNGFEKKAHWVADYFDRRAQVKYAEDHPESALSMGEQVKFKSSWGDPRSAPQGSLIGMVRSGLVNDERAGRRNDRRRDKEKEERKGLIGGAKGMMMKQNVLYLMIVNDPSEDGDKYHSDRNHAGGMEHQAFR